MDILEIAQTIFYFTVSFAVIVIGMLVAFLIMDAILIIRSMKRLFDGLHQESVAVYRKIDGILQNVAGLSFFSKWFSRRRPEKRDPEM